MNRMPTINSYGQYSSDNYGSHTLRVEIGNVTLWFSYKTLVAFCTPDTGLVVSQNVWGRTTGKHLKWIDGGNKKSRLNRDEFEAKWKEVAERFNVEPALTV
jgi:hypothetical protein